MASLGMTRAKIDSLDSDVDAIVLGDSPETKYFLKMMEKKRAEHRKMNQSSSEFEASSPKRLFYNVDLLDNSTRSIQDPTIPSLVPADTPTKSPIPGESPTYKKQLNWRSSRSPRKSSSDEQVSFPKYPSLRQPAAPVRHSKMIWIVTCTVVLSLLSGCFDGENTRSSVMINDFIMTTATAFLTYIGRASSSLLSIYENDDLELQLSPKCSTSFNKIIHADCRQQVRKIKEQQQRRPAL